VSEELLRSTAPFSDYLCPGVNPKSTLGHKGNSYHLHVIAEAHCGRWKKAYWDVFWSPSWKVAKALPMDVACSTL